MRSARLTRVGGVGTASAAVALLTIFVIGVLAVTPANAVDVYWANPVNSNYTWTGGPWEDLGHTSVGPPANGDRVMLVTSHSLAHCSINVAGAMLNLPASGMGFGYGGRNWSFYDSATLTPNADPMANPTDFNLGTYPSLEAAAAASTQTLTLGSMDWSKSGNPYFFMPVVVNGTMKNPENGPLHFYGPATIGTDDVPRNTGWTADLYYHGNATIGTKNVAFRADGNDEETWFYGVTNITTLNQDGGKVYFEPTSSVTITTLNLSRGIFNTKVAPTITTVNWTGGVWAAGANGALPSAAPFTLSSGQALRFDVVQTSLPVITVGAGGALAGNMTNVVYTPGPGQNVIFQNDGIHAPNPEAATALQKSDLGAGVGVWLGVTSRGAGDTWQAGDDGTSPYKGLAFDTNSFTPPGETRSTFKANPGSGDLLLRVASLLDLEYRGPYWIGDGTSTTANFDMVGQTARIDLRRRFNQGSTDADRILTFNVTRAPGHERSSILTTNQQPGVYADQTVNVTGGNVGNLNAMKSRLEGTLTLTNGVWGQGNDFTAADTGTLTLAGRTALENMGAGNNDFLEQLGTFNFSGTTMVDLAERQTYTFDWNPAGSMPVLAELLKNSDWYRHQMGRGIVYASDVLVGHGRFFTNSYDRGAGNAAVGQTGSEKILFAQNGPADGTDWMGFAANLANFPIDMDVDALGAIIQVGTTDPDRIANVINGGFETVIPTHEVRFQRNVAAGGIRVESGTARFDQDLTTGTVSILSGATLRMASGRTATVNGTLSGGGTFTGGNGVLLTGTGTLAPGDSPGTLTGSLLSVDDGATYQWEILDPDGIAGDPGGWDLFMGGVVDLDPDNDNDDTINFEIVDLGIPREIAAAERFLVASGTDLQLPNDLAVNFSVVPDVAVWNLSAAELVPAPGGPGFELFLTGVTATFQTEIIPEPSSFVLAVLGLLLLAACRFRRRERR